MNYTYDAFQLKAIEAIKKEHSVLVSAPTGAGKTAIAEYAIEQCLREGRNAVYTAPVKAISNQKYRDFGARYPNHVGLLTGDVSINPGAQVLIMTTEIYRNQLFENPKRHEDTSWVIFDEIHYLDDYERGTVWEEAIMFSLRSTRFLALSATSPNIKELADWISFVQHHPITVVLENKRPVKLIHEFHCQNQVHQDVDRLKKDGFLNVPQWPSRFRSHPGQRRFRRHHWHKELRATPNSTFELFQHLIKRDRLPCLYFAFSRKRVEELASQHTELNLLSEEASRQNLETFDRLCTKYELTEERSAKEMRYLVGRGVGYHHAGMLPTLKEVVEQLFTDKSIHLIFTTETFALGINMPARTVVFDELKKFYGFGFEHLTTRDYYQMAGRAGRRNLDVVGYVYSRINPHHIPYPTVVDIVYGEMEPIRSQFNASYATLLNLYKHLREKLLDMYPNSFHHFQSGPKLHRRATKQIQHKVDLLRQLGYIDEKGLTPKGDFASCLYGYELVLSELLEAGYLDQLSPILYGVLLLALVYEPRRNEHSGRIPKHLRFLEKNANRVYRKIQQVEDVAKVKIRTRPPHFHLSKAIEAWMSGCDFDELFHHTDVDEGILIRHFRMVIQLLRQLQTAPGVPSNIKKTCSLALPLINRDIVDAEKLLRSA